MSIRNIDHLVLPVANLALARDRLTALGFTVAAEATHPFGTANACVFLDDGIYLEPLAVVDRRRATMAAKRGNVFVDRDLAFRGKKGRQGLSAIVVATEDAQEDNRRYQETGLSAGEMLEFARLIKSPEGDDREGRFRLAFAAMNDSPSLFAFACQRLVAFPQDLGSLRLHANAVTGLKEIVLSAADQPGSDLLLREVLQAPAQAGEAGLTFQAANTRVRVREAREFAMEFGLPVDASTTGLNARALIFRTADLAVTEIILAANDVAFIRRDGRVLVSPAPGQGVLFGFEE